MKLLALALTAAVGIMLIRQAVRRDRSTVSPQWLVDHERRQWGIGRDQVCIQWPIKKAENESALWNRAQHRRRA